MEPTRTPPDVLQRADHLRVELQRHSALYYQHGTPEISDEQFDALWNELETLENTYPELGTPDSPTQRINDGTAGGRSTVRHQHPMLSLAKIVSTTELRSFLAKIAPNPVRCQIKFDGVSLALRYRGGTLDIALTRGDGETGEDVTENVRSIVNVPQTLRLPVDCEIRGEVVMRRSDFDRYNADHPDTQLANPRNAAAGTLMAKDREAVSARVLTFMPFDLIMDDSSVDPIDRLTTLGFDVEPTVLVTAGYPDERFPDATLVEVLEFIEAVEANRGTYDFDLDGVVIRIADRRAYDQAGVRSRTPIGAVAYKLAAERTTTTLTAITMQVGKSGINAPVAELAPVFLSGTTISRATLHNAKFIADNDIRVGDTVEILRAGDVIPRVDRAITEHRTGDEVPWERPTTCASCGNDLTVDGPSLVLRCPNTSMCTAQSLRRIIHWASRSAADIDALGSTWIDTMLTSGLINSPADLYTITYQQLRPNGEHGPGAFDRMGERLARKILTSIERSKDVGLRRALIGWAIPLCSEGTAKRLCRAGFTLDMLMEATVDGLVVVDDIGDIVAQSIVKHFQDASTRSEIAAMRRSGVNFDVRDEDRAVERSDEDPFSGEIVVFTGKLESFSRKAGEQIVEQHGGKTSGSVTKNTTLLVAGPGAGSKLKAAEKHQVPVIDEQQFLDRLDTAGISV